MHALQSLYGCKITNAIAEADSHSPNRHFLGSLYIQLGRNFYQILTQSGFSVRDFEIPRSGVVKFSSAFEDTYLNLFSALANLTIEQRKHSQSAKVFKIMQNSLQICRLGMQPNCLFWVHHRTLSRHMGQTKGPIKTVDTALKSPNYCLLNALWIMVVRHRNHKILDHLCSPPLKSQFGNRFFIYIYRYESRYSPISRIFTNPRSSEENSVPYREI